MQSAHGFGFTRRRFSRSGSENSCFIFFGKPSYAEASVGRGAITKKVWFYQLNLARNLGKGQPLSDVGLQKTKADSTNSWSIDVKTVDQNTFDLSVKNPNKNDEVVLREPKEILEEMKNLDEESKEIFKNIKKII